MSISFFASIKSITVPIKEVWDSKRLGFALGCWNDRFLGKLSWYSKKIGERVKKAFGKSERW